MTDSANPTNDCNESQESIDKKILNEFKKYEKGFCLKTGGRRSRMKTDGSSLKRILRSQTGFARIAMMVAYYCKYKINSQYLILYELV